MAHPQTSSQQQQMFRDVRPRPVVSKQRFFADLSQCLFDFVIQLLPTAEELSVKEDVRKLLERLIRTIEPDSRLLSFGSTANGFSLRNSDMDLCCLIDSDERLQASDLVTMLGDLLERETKFHVKPLPHARIPIVKLSLDPSPGLPLGIACDIGFENRLALENTRLLMCYAMIDPTRVRTLVLFLKVWSKRRKINSPYKGTLSSYGYVLLVIYFLVHVKNPPVLPNLQQIPPLRPIPKEETHINGHNIWFFDDIELLRQRWHSENTESVAELLVDFFRYYSREFSFNTGVASIRAGLLKKESKGWQNELSQARYSDARERNRLCIEDPFEGDYNVARCVTRDGLYTIRGEFMRAVRILALRPERAVQALAEMCEERKDEDLVSAPPHASPRPSLPPQTPYSVGSQTMRPRGTHTPERLSPPTKFADASVKLPFQHVPNRSPPEHMAPKRSKWTSPPPPEAPSVDHSLFEAQLGKGLELATASTAAREHEDAYNSSSSNNSDIFEEDRSDIAEFDDIRSIRSFTEGASPSAISFRRPPSWLMHNAHPRYVQPQVEVSTDTAAGMIPGIPGPRGRPKHSERDTIPSLVSMPGPSKSEMYRRSLSGPPRSIKGLSWNSNTPVPKNVPLPPSPESPLESQFSEPSTVYYQTGARSPQHTMLFPYSGSPSPVFSQYQTQQQYILCPPPEIFTGHAPMITSLHSRPNETPSGLVNEASPSLSPGNSTPTLLRSHSHSHSTTTITAPTPPPNVSSFSATEINSNVAHISPSPNPNSQSPKIPPITPLSRSHFRATTGSMSPQSSCATSNGSSPSIASTGYATSVSRSPSPVIPMANMVLTAAPLHDNKSMLSTSLNDVDR